MSDVMCQCRRW